MTAIRIQRAAGERLDEIYHYTREKWGEAQAEIYLRSLFDRFEQIAARKVPWRSIRADLGVDGYFCRHEHHYIYWKVLGDGAVGIVTVLHERMHQMDRLADDLE